MPPPESRRAQVVVPILTCLAHLHAAGVIHRDIKLENLFVAPGRGVLLGDFGLALSVHEEKPISPVGTLGRWLRGWGWAGVGKMRRAR
jgi:serine/threonine protein kinase